MTKDVRRALAPLDPIAHLAKISPRPVLLQFGTKDPFVTNEAATAMAGAVPGPKTMKTYEFEHKLTVRRGSIGWRGHASSSSSRRIRYMIFASLCLSDLRGVSRDPVSQSLFKENHQFPALPQEK
jgi:hypothetical protein